MKRLRYLIALWAIKASHIAAKLLGGRSTHFPGRIGLKICPDFLAQADKPERIIAVTGTNGKTTSSNFINDILEKNGIRALNNRAGANIDAGIATALALGSTIFGKTKHNLAVLEVDERFSPKIYKYIKPDYLLITNLFRDSMMRNAHTEYISGILNGSIPPTTKLIVNGNDLIASGIAPNNPRVYYGIDNLAQMTTDFENLMIDMRLCPNCREQLVYDYRFYHHLGKAHCPECGFQSPECDYLVKGIDTEAMTMTVSDKDGAREIALINTSVFNIFNTLAAVALLREFGLTYDQINGSLKEMQVIGSRFAEETVNGVKIVTLMAKELNPIACSRCFDYVTSQPEQKEIIVNVYNPPDVDKGSEFIPWIYDCDFEYLKRDNIKRIVVTGGNVADHYLRLLIAGVPEEKIKYCPDEEDELTYLELQGTEGVYIIHSMDQIVLATRHKAALKERLSKRAE